MEMDEESVLRARPCTPRSVRSLSPWKENWEVELHTETFRGCSILPRRTPGHQRNLLSVSCHATHVQSSKGDLSVEKYNLQRRTRCHKDWKKQPEACKVDVRHCPMLERVPSEHVLHLLFIYLLSRVVAGIKE